MSISDFVNSIPLKLSLSLCHHVHVRMFKRGFIATCLKVSMTRKITQSQTVGRPTAPRGRDTEH